MRGTSPDPNADVRCEQCGQPIDLDERGTLTVRHARSGDEAGLRELYAGLDTADLLTRFFTAGQPGPHLLERWVTVGDRGGLCLLAEVEDAESRHVVAEAGFAPLTDGDVELGITVARDHRGWVGPWMLDLLLDHAAKAGFDNMQALVKTRNRSMLGIIRHRGCARFDDADWETTRVTMSTSGRTPSWPPDAKRPRVLIESPRSRPDIARRVRDANGTVLICSGYGTRGSKCPLHAGETCPLVTGADAVVIDANPLSDGQLDAQALHEAIGVVHPEARVVAVDPPSGDLPHRSPPIDLGFDSPHDASNEASTQPNTESER